MHGEIVYHLWGLLPEQVAHQPVVPDWPRSCVVA